MMRAISDVVVVPVIERIANDIFFVICADYRYKKLPKGGIGEVFRKHGLTEAQYDRLVEDYGWVDCDRFIEAYQDMISVELEFTTCDHLWTQDGRPSSD